MQCVGVDIGRADSYGAGREGVWWRAVEWVEVLGRGVIGGDRRGTYFDQWDYGVED